MKKYYLKKSEPKKSEPTKKVRKAINLDRFKALPRNAAMHVAAWADAFSKRCKAWAERAGQRLRTLSDSLAKRIGEQKKASEEQSKAAEQAKDTSLSKEKSKIPAGAKKYKVTRMSRPRPLSAKKKKNHKKIKMKLPKLKKIPMPPWFIKFLDKIARFFSKKLVSRLAVGICALGLGAVLILWDLGLIHLPFLVRRDRREPLTETATEEEPPEEADDQTTEESKDGNDDLAVAAIRGLYAFAGVNTAKTPITDLVYNDDTMTLTKQILPEGNFAAAMGFVINTTDGAEMLFTASDLQEILDSDGYRLTHYRTESGDAVFTKNDQAGYFRFDSATRQFSPVSFDPTRAVNRDLGFPMPRSYGKNENGPVMIAENGLYGYQGSYQDGTKTKSFTVPPTYPTAFAYSEGFAVMADASGKVTIRNDRGEAVFTEYNLILPEQKGKESLGFFYFDGGVLRVVVAGYDAQGKLTSRRETMINTRGQEVSLPGGYQVVSSHEGILLVTDGTYYGYLSAKGAWISPPVYSNAAPFYEGLAVVTDKDGKMGLIDSEGKTVLPCAFDQITDFSDGHGLCYSKATGWYLLTKVNGVYYHDPSQEETQVHTKSSITRGPQNTFVYEPDEIIVLLPPESLPERTTHPENTTSSSLK